MSGVSLPVNRPVGRALVVGGASLRAGPVEILQRLYSFECGEADDPYNAMLELCRRKVVYNAVILSLAGMYREELSLIATVKRRFPHLEIWLAHTDNRPALLAEAIKLGADGLLGDDGLHRMAAAPAPAEPHAFPKIVDDASDHAESADSPHDAAAAEVRASPGEARDGSPHDPLLEPPIGEPVLTAEELRALLHEQPSMPPAPGNQQES